MRRHATSRFALALAGLAGLSVASPARADGLGRRLLQGVTYAFSPSIGTVQNGPNFNNNAFSQRFNENLLTDGRSYEVVRFFGSDTFGNPETLNLGLVNVQLSEPPGSLLRGAGFYGRVGYNRRIVPEFYWDFRTTGRNIAGGSIGTSSVRTPVQYLIESNIGLQELTLAGQFDINTSGSMNALGFYDFTLTMSNTGTAVTDGALGDESRVTDFDLGPVNVSGNIGLDVTLALFDFLGEQAGLPEDLIPDIATRSRSPDEVLEAINDGETVSMSDLNGLFEAWANDPAGIDLSSASGPTLSPSTGGEAAAPVPEPGTAALLAVCVAMFGVRVRRRMS